MLKNQFTCSSASASARIVKDWPYAMGALSLSMTRFSFSSTTEVHRRKRRSDPRGFESDPYDQVHVRGGRGPQPHYSLRQQKEDGRDGEQVPQAESRALLP